MDLKKVLQDAGILGAGGAGFPSYAKLAEGADLLVINGAECEPLLETDYYLLREHLHEMTEGARLLCEAWGIGACVLGIKHHNALRLGWSDRQMLGFVQVRVLPDVYPMGDEINLIYEATGRLVQPGALPITQGVIVYNVETLVNIYHAMTEGAPVTLKYLTVGGAIDQPIVTAVPVGTPVRVLFERLGITVPADCGVLDGGPSMGRLIHPESAVVSKTTKSLLILPRSIPAMVSKLRTPQNHEAIASSVCCQCTRCTDMCPRNLLGYPLEPHRHVRMTSRTAAFEPQSVIDATLCCGCGICEIAACCQQISPCTVIRGHKALLAQNKLRFTAKEQVQVRPERAYRMLPSERWKSLLGVRVYDKPAAFRAISVGDTPLEIALRPHIGAPSVAAVAVGDVVTAGQMIAAAGAGLSLPQHAPRAGRVLAVDDTRILIG